MIKVTEASQVTSEGRGCRSLVRVRTGESGSILVFAALMMTALVGVMALAIDGSYMYEQRNRMASAADAAAKAGAQELARQGTGHDTDTCTGVGTGPGICATLKAFADHEAAALPSYGFAHTDVVMNRPPLNGPFAGNIGYVEVIVSRQLNTFFGGVLGVLSMTPSARAVAGAGSSPVCIMALNTTPTSGGSGFAIDIANMTTLGNPGCAVVTNNHIIVHRASGRITASPVSIKGPGAGTTGPRCDPASSNCPAGIIYSETYEPDPYPNGILPFPQPPIGVPCNPLTDPDTNAILYGTMYMGGDWQCYSSIGSGAAHFTFHFTPGNYYVQGDFSCGTNCTVDCPTCTGGAGVFFYFNDTFPTSHGGRTVGFGSNSSWNLTAPTTGPYAGFLFFFNRNNVRGIFLGNGANFGFAGAIYGLQAVMDFSSGTVIGIGDCTVIVAGRISMGFGGLTSGCASFGGGGSVIASRSALAE